MIGSVPLGGLVSQHEAGPLGVVAPSDEEPV